MKNPSELTNKDIGVEIYHKNSESKNKVIFVGKYNDKCYNYVVIFNCDDSRINGVSKDDFDDIFTLEKPKEKPIVDWSVIPEWFNWIARNEDGRWFAYHIIPEIAVMYKAGEGYWKNFDGFWFTESPPEYAPKFNGDWKDSLVERPK